MKIITLEILNYFKQKFKDEIIQLINDSISNSITGGVINITDVQSLYPIGSIYISANNINPHDIFKFGEWERIEDCFLLGAGKTYNLNDTGGGSNPHINY